MTEVSYSQLATWLQCKKKWAYHYKEGLRTNKFRAAMDKGTAWHGMLAQTGGKYDLEVFKELWNAQCNPASQEYSNRGWDSSSIEKDRQSGLYWADKVIKQAKQIGIEELYNAYVPEVEFCELIHPGLGIRIRGFLDGIVTMSGTTQYGYQGEQKIIEYKTTGQYQEGNIELDMQQGIYQLIYGLETLYVWFTANGIKLVPFKFNDNALAQVRSIVERCIEDMFNEEQYLRAPSGACYNYCDFGQLCVLDLHGGDRDYLISEQYSKGQSEDAD